MIAVFDHTATMGTNGQRGRSTAINALKFTLFTDATIVAYSVNLMQYSTTGDARVALYTHDAGTNLPSTIVADSTVLKAASTLTGTMTLYQLDLAAPLSLGAGVYWLVMDDNANSSAYVVSGLNTGANDGFRKVYAGTATSNYTWSWALWADDNYVPLGYERYYVDPSDTGSLELGTDAEPFKSLQTAITSVCNKTFVQPIKIRCRTSGSTADTTRVTDGSLGQMVASSTNYLEIVAETGHRAGTVWDTAKYHLYPAYSAQAGTALAISEAHVRVDGLQIGISSITATAEMVYWSNGGSGQGRLSNCLIKGPSSTTYLTRGISLIHGITMWNCIIQVSTKSDSTCVQNHGDSSFYGCTFIGGGGVTVTILDGTCVAKNCYAGVGTKGYEVTTGSLTLTTCASSDATTGSSGLQSIAVNTTNFTNVTTDTEDWALPGTGSALYGVGTSGLTDDPPGSTALALDITGATRTTTWDIGADEYIAAGASGQPASRRSGGILHSLGASPLSTRRW